MTRTKDLSEQNPDPFYSTPEQQEPTFEHLAIHEILPSKSNIGLMAHGIHRAVLDGKVEPKKAAIRLKAIIELSEQALKLIAPAVIEAVDKGDYDLEGCKVEKMEAGVKYDYSANPEWVNLNRTLIETQQAMKELEDRLKKIPAGSELVDTETGEVLTGPAKTSTTTFKVTLAK